MSMPPPRHTRVSDMTIAELLVEARLVLRELRDINEQLAVAHGLKGTPDV